MKKNFLTFILPALLLLACNPGPDRQVFNRGSSMTSILKSGLNGSPSWEKTDEITLSGDTIYFLETESREGVKQSMADTAFITSEKMLEEIMNLPAENQLANQTVKLVIPADSTHFTSVSMTYSIRGESGLVHIYGPVDSVVNHAVYMQAERLHERIRQIAGKDPKIFL